MASASSTGGACPHWLLGEGCAWYNGDRCRLWHDPDLLWENTCHRSMDHRGCNGWRRSGKACNRIHPGDPAFCRSGKGCHRGVHPDDPGFCRSGKRRRRGVHPDDQPEAPPEPRPRPARSPEPAGGQVVKCMTQWMQGRLQDCDGSERRRLCAAWRKSLHPDKIHEERLREEIAGPVTQYLNALLEQPRLALGHG